MTSTTFLSRLKHTGSDETAKCDKHISLVENFKKTVKIQILNQRFSKFFFIFPPYKPKHCQSLPTKITKKIIKKI